MRNLLEAVLRCWFISFLKDKDRYTLHPQLPCDMTKLIGIFLHTIADINKRVDFLLPGLLQGVIKDFTDLRMASQAIHTGERIDERLAVFRPGGRAKFSKPSKIGDL